MKQLNLSIESIAALAVLADRYYFGLFQNVIENEQEEFAFRDALMDFLKEAKEQL